MQGYGQIYASASLVFLHQSQNKGAGLSRFSGAAVHLRQDEAKLRVLPEQTWNAHEHTITDTPFFTLYSEFVSLHTTVLSL